MSVLAYPQIDDSLKKKGYNLCLFRNTYDWGTEWKAVYMHSHALPFSGKGATLDEAISNAYIKYKEDGDD